MCYIYFQEHDYIKNFQIMGKSIRVIGTYCFELLSHVLHYTLLETLRQRRI
jgi:hypothetical protein